MPSQKNTYDTVPESFSSDLTCNTSRLLDLSGLRKKKTGEQNFSSRIFISWFSITVLLPNPRRLPPYLTNSSYVTLTPSSRNETPGMLLCKHDSCGSKAMVSLTPEHGALLSTMTCPLYYWQQATGPYHCSLPTATHTSSRARYETKLPVRCWEKRGVRGGSSPLHQNASPLSLYDNNDNRRQPQQVG